ncbi:MAG TPA: hypothetical protein VJR58_07615 [Vineibacter sp.]|nr:hypothetical protein [Vineibacter sp.]
MSRRLAAFVVASFSAIAVPGARADIPPPPGSQERAAAALIRDHGHDCPRVTRLAVAPETEAQALAKQGLDASIASCSTGKQFLVAVPFRRPGPPRPDAPPPATPVVKPLP